MLKIKQFVLKNKILRWLPAVLVMMVIFSLSAKTGGESKAQSAGLARLILSFFGLSESVRDVLIVILRKGAHFSLFALLGASVLYALFGYKIKRSRAFLICILICLVYAASDELHQSLVPGRGPLIRDVVIDFSGSLSGSGATMLIYKLKEKIKFSKEA